MSPRKAAAAKPAAAAPKPIPAAKPESRAAPTRAAAKPKPAVVADGAGSAQARELAATIEGALREGNLDALTPQAFQALMAALCKYYGAQVEAGRDLLPLAGRQSVSPTEVMTTTSGILKAANLAVFELGMWQSWTGR
jgi:hypothetical protein